MPDEQCGAAGDGVAVIDIHGDITAASEDALERGLRGRRPTNGAQTVLIDFSGLEYMNSGGIGLLVTLLVRANRAKSRCSRAG